MIQVGDRVVCVDASMTVNQHLESTKDIPLVQGKHYIVYDMLHGHCETVVDVGIIDSPDIASQTCRCGVIYPNSRIGTWWFALARFRKVEERVIEYTAKVEVEIQEPILS